ncbi:cell division protein ZapA [Tropicimonas isoalkanivorans]|uniref:Cell division protein ZapA n=1 Tax=Tropicimonas isoalkanivorans TaxID=441112 RepID=A0A1I1E791_9RHOB|nr:cell division protein ZapA [Tropicimonas isoalkanivorans]SFB80813.1 cell division protein ZapA [Tropicimonas isoalkanivorans]
MPEVQISIGGRDFTVACQDGEEQYLQSAAAMLDREARGLVSQIGRMPETRMLLMAGLMLADRTAAYEERAAAAEQRVAQQQRQIDDLQGRPAPEPERVEVPVVPTALTDSLAEIAARAEALAALAEEKTAG